MKSSFIFLLCITINYTIQAQSIDSIKITSIDRGKLLSKSKLQKTVGWTIFGTGIPVILVTGYLLIAVNKNDIDKPTLTKVFLASTVYTLISIPLIRAGRLNKKLALSIGLTHNKVPEFDFESFIVKRQPAISFQIP